MTGGTKCSSHSRHFEITRNVTSSWRPNPAIITGSYLDRIESTHRISPASNSNLLGCKTLSIWTPEQSLTDNQFLLWLETLSSRWLKLFQSLSLPFNVVMSHAWPSFWNLSSSWVYMDHSKVKRALITNRITVCNSENRGAHCMNNSTITQSQWQFRHKQNTWNCF